MSIWTRKSEIIITCAKGISPFLREEVASMGFPVLSQGVAEVKTEGLLEDTMKLNLLIRTGHRILFLLESFHAKTPDELYKKVSRINWEDYIPEDSFFSVTSSVSNPTIKDSRFANVKCKDAMVDRIKEKCGKRPNTGPERDKIVIHLYWKDALCKIFCDTSGEPLSKRGYRKNPMKAPMQETLAASVILATHWRGDGSLINPMCGSGTLAIEAALIGLERAPGLLRSNFGFMHLKGFNETSWKAFRRITRAASKNRLNGRIIATDFNPQAIEAAKKNAATAGVDHFIEFGVCQFFETPLSAGGGVVILNPEYGERMGEIGELKETYKRIGDFFKKKCNGYTGFIFTGNFDLTKKVGLRTKRRIPFFNGPMECRLLEYDLYEGSRRKVMPQL